jgi:hypothetical protein
MTPDILFVLYTVRCMIYFFSCVEYKGEENENKESIVFEVRDEKLLLSYCYQ